MDNLTQTGHRTTGARENSMTSDDAITAIVAGRATFFAGAGFSVEATVGGKPLPNGSELSSLLMSKLGSTDAADYTLAAELYCSEKGEPALLDFLREQLSASTVSNSQAVISKQPWRRVYTTNFDNVIELACHKSARPYISLTPVDSPPPIKTDQSTIVHLHGFIGESAASQHGIDLARSRLVHSRLQRTSWPTQIQVDIESSDALFIVGYSLSDFHIAQLLRTTNAVKRKTFLVVENDCSAALSAYLSRFGTVLPIGLAEFARRISNAASNSEHVYGTSQITCFEHFQPPETVKTPTTEDTISLLLTGFFDDSVYAGSGIDGAPPYSIFRRRMQSLTSLGIEQAATIVLQSRIGNGKSIFTHQLQHDLTKNGAAVWVAKHPLPAIYSELDSIRKLKQRRVFVFDPTDGFEQAITNVSQNLVAGDILVISTRFADVQSDSSPIRAMLPGGYVRYDLNALSDDEIIKLEAWISYYGLWGDVAGNSPSARIRFIREKCGRELRSVIISLFQHGSLEQRIKSGLDDINKSEIEVKSAFAALLVARFANCPLDFFDICELVDVEPYSTRETLSMVGGGEFVEFHTGDFDVRSPVLAEFLLARCLAPEIAFTAITTMIDILTTLQSADWRYEESLPLLMKFSIISKIFPSDERRNFIVPFYEHLLKHSAVKANPHFWLQFAMARMEREEYDIVEKCLENAYREARRRGPTWRLYMLDNQKIKFLLKSRMRSDSYPDKISAYSDALKLFASQVRNVKDGIDVHVLRLIDPLMQYDAMFGTIIPVDLKAIFKREMIELRNRTIVGIGPTTGEEDRLISLLPKK